MYFTFNVLFDDLFCIVSYDKIGVLLPGSVISKVCTVGFIFIFFETSSPSILKYIVCSLQDSSVANFM